MKTISGIPTSEKILVNEVGNKELRKNHSFKLEQSGESAFHHIRITNQTPIDQLLIEKKITIDQHHAGIQYSEIIYKAGAFLKSPSFEFRDMKNNFSPPAPPTRVIILSGVQKYLRTEASPKVESLLWKVVAREKTPRELEVTPLRFGLEMLNNYWYPKIRRSPDRSTQIQKIFLQSLG